MGQFYNSLLGRNEEKKQKPTDAEQKPKQQADKKQPPEQPEKQPEKQPELIKGKPVELPGNSQQTAWSQSSLDFLKDIAMSTPETQAVVVELGKKLEKLDKKEFYRCFVHVKHPEEDYFTNELEALEAWGTDYRAVFRLAPPDREDGQPQPLGRLATKEETKECLLAEAKKREKKRK